MRSRSRIGFFLGAMRELQAVRDFVGSPENILGRAATKHGEIAERVHVGVSRAWDVLHRRAPIATTDGVPRTGPVDYRVDGVDIQSKYYNGLRNTLDGVASHAEKYPGFPDGPGRYHIPHELLEHHAAHFGVDLDDLPAVPRDLSALPWATRVLVFRDAVTLAQVDGMSAEEERYLDALAERMALPAETAGAIGAQRACDTPANDHPGEDVDDERDVDEAGPRRHVGEIGDPQGIGPRRRERAVHQVRRPGRRVIRDRRLEALAPDGALEPHIAHQPGGAAASHPDARARQLPPDFADAIYLKVRVPHPLDLGLQPRMHLGHRSLIRFSSPSSASPVGNRNGRKVLLQRRRRPGCVQM